MAIREQPGTDCELSEQVHTLGTTVQLPLPDFSMPYNVACMTCTLLGVFMGLLLNVMFRCKLGGTS